MTTSPGDPRDVLGRPGPLPDEVVRYAGHPDGVLDIYEPEAYDALVVLLHGGFWQHEYDRLHLRALAAAIAGEGFLVALPEFRRITAPGSAWPAIFEDVVAAAAYATGLASIARRRLPAVLVGHSAGGHLALWAAAQKSVEPRLAPAAGVVALAPVADLAAAARLHLENDAVIRLLGGTEAQVPQRWARADPMRLLPLPVPVEMVHGTADQHVPLSITDGYVAAAARVGSDVRLTTLAGCGHFELIDPRNPATSTVYAAIRRLTRAASRAG